MNSYDRKQATVGPTDHATGSPSNTSINGKGVNKRESAIIYNQYKTYGSNFFLMLANSIANYEDAEDDADEENDTERYGHRYTADETIDETLNVDYDPYHVESWKKYLNIFANSIKRSNVVAKKYIKRGKKYAMEQKYKLTKRRKKDEFFAFHVAKSDVPMKSKKVALQEREWFATQFARQMGPAPDLVDEEIVLQSLMKKARRTRVRASKYYTNTVDLNPSTATTLSWRSTPRMIKCVCPVRDCICLGNTLLPPKSIPRGPCLPSKRRPPSGTLVPKLVKATYVERNLYSLMHKENLLEKFGPEMCVFGCRNFFYYDRTDISNAQSRKKEELRQTIIAGQYTPIKEDPTFDEGLESESSSTQAQEAVPEIEDSVEEEEIPEDYDDRICDYRGRCCVSSQVERGADGEFAIAYPYVIKFPTIMKNISGMKLNVSSICTGLRLKCGIMHWENIIPLQSMKKRWYDNWKKEFYLSVFQTPERETEFSLQTTGTQTDDELKQDDNPPEEEKEKYIPCACNLTELKEEVVPTEIPKNITKETTQKDIGKLTSGVMPESMQPKNTVTPEEQSKASNVNQAASLDKKPTPNVKPDVIPKVAPNATQHTKLDAQSGKTVDPKQGKDATAKASPVQKGLEKKVSLPPKENTKHLTEKPVKNSKKSLTTSSASANNDTKPIPKTPSQPQKTSALLETKPKSAKKELSKKSLETNKKSKTAEVSKSKDEKAKTVKSILTSPNVVTGNALDYNLEKHSCGETSREHIIREILFEPQDLPHNTPHSKISTSSKEKETNAITTQPKTSGSRSKTVSIASEKEKKSSKSSRED